MTDTKTPLERRIEAVPTRYRALYRKAIDGELSPRAAIKIKCLDCCGWERFDGGEDRIRDCTVRGCPLWPLRPFQKPRESLEVPEAATSSKEVAPDDPQGLGGAL